MSLSRFLPILATLPALGIASAADAADAPHGWGGVYVGAVTGVRWANDHYALPGDQADVLLSNHANKSSWFGGGLIGFNAQSGNIVFGAEADLVGGQARTQVTACTVPDGCWTPAHDSFTTYNHLKQTLTGHARARIGIASGNTLFYAAGGYSVAKTRLDLVGNCFNGGNPTVPLIFNYSRKKTISGFNVGAGVEHRFGDHVLMRAEYVFDDFGHQLYRGDGVEWNDRRIGIRNSNVRIGVAFTF
jgi:outer membrane immunogenic protein